MSSTLNYQDLCSLKSCGRKKICLENGRTVGIKQHENHYCHRYWVEYRKSCWIIKPHIHHPHQSSINNSMKIINTKISNLIAGKNQATICWRLLIFLMHFNRVDIIAALIKQISKNDKRGIKAVIIRRSS